jgi:drug/metabolite transporter (DMT)-like permease
VILLGEQLTVAEVAGLALIVVGAEITVRGDRARRAGSKAKAYELRVYPPFN